MGSVGQKVLIPSRNCHTRCRPCSRRMVKSVITRLSCHTSSYPFCTELHQTLYEPATEPYMIFDSALFFRKSWRVLLSRVSCPITDGNETLHLAISPSCQFSLGLSTYPLRPQKVCF